MSPKKKSGVKTVSVQEAKDGDTIEIETLNTTDGRTITRWMVARDLKNLELGTIYHTPMSRKDYWMAGTKSTPAGEGPDDTIVFVYTYEEPKKKRGRRPTGRVKALKKPKVSGSNPTAPTKKPSLKGNLGGTARTVVPPSGLAGGVTRRGSKPTDEVRAQQ